MKNNQYCAQMMVVEKDKRNNIISEVRKTKCWKCQEALWRYCVNDFYKDEEASKVPRFCMIEQRYYDIEEYKNSLSSIEYCLCFCKRLNQVISDKTIFCDMFEPVQNIVEKKEVILNEGNYEVFDNFNEMEIRMPRAIPTHYLKRKDIK